VLLTDILPTGYLGALRADITPGDTVVVVGLGPSGSWRSSAPALRPAHILAVDVVPTASRVLLDSAPNRSTHATEGRWPPSRGHGGTRCRSRHRGCRPRPDHHRRHLDDGGQRHGLGDRGQPQHGAAVPMGFAFLRSITVRSTIAAIPAHGRPHPLLESGRLRPKAPSPTIWALRVGTPTPFSMSARRVLKVLLDPRR